MIASDISFSCLGIPPGWFSHSYTVTLLLTTSHTHTHTKKLMNIHRFFKFFLFLVLTFCCPLCAFPFLFELSLMQIKSGAFTSKRRFSTARSYV